MAQRVERLETKVGLEGMNNKVKVISHRAYGYSTTWAFIANIYHCCAGLPLPRHFRERSHRMKLIVKYFAAIPALALILLIFLFLSVFTPLFKSIQHSDAASLAGPLLTLQYIDPETDSIYDSHSETTQVVFVSGQKVLKAYLFTDSKAFPCPAPHAEMAGKCIQAPPGMKYPEVTFVVRRWVNGAEVTDVLPTTQGADFIYTATWDTTNGNYPDGIYIIDMKVKVRNGSYPVHKVPLPAIVDNVPGVSAHPYVPFCDSKWTVNYESTNPSKAPYKGGASLGVFRSQAGHCEWIAYPGSASALTIKSAPLVPRTAVPFSTRPTNDNAGANTLWMQKISPGAGPAVGSNARFTETPALPGSSESGHVNISLDGERFLAKDGERNVGTKLIMIPGFVDLTTENSTKDWLYGAEISSTRYGEWWVSNGGTTYWKGRVLRISPTGNSQTVIGTRRKADVLEPYHDSNNTEQFPDGVNYRDSHFEVVGIPAATEPADSRTGVFEPNDVIQDPRPGNENILYVSDTLNHRVLKITLSSDPSGTAQYETYAGSPSGVSGYVDGKGTDARFEEPWGLDMSPAGDLYVADRLIHAIRKIDTDREVTTVFRSSLYGTSDDPGSGTVTQTQRTPKISGVTLIKPTNPLISTYLVDGAFASSTLIFPHSLRSDSNGNLIVWEAVINAIRRIDLVNRRIDTLTFAPSGTFSTGPWYQVVRVDKEGQCGPQDDLFVSSVLQPGTVRMYPNETGAYTSVPLLSKALSSDVETGRALRRSEWRGILAICGGGAIWTGQARTGLARVTLATGSDPASMSMANATSYGNGFRVYRSGTVNFFPLRTPLNLTHPVHDQFGGDTFEHLNGVTNTELRDRILAGWNSPLGPRPEITGKDLSDLVYFIRWNCGTCVDADYELAYLTPPADTVAGAPSFTVSPTVSATTSSSVTIAWSTNENTVGFVEYAEEPYIAADPKNSMYGNASSVQTSSTSHSVPLSDLQPNATYHYRVRVKDAYGNQSASGDLTFTTAP